MALLVVVVVVVVVVLVVVSGNILSSSPLYVIPSLATNLTLVNVENGESPEETVRLFTAVGSYYLWSRLTSDEEKLNLIAANLYLDVIFYNFGNPPTVSHRHAFSSHILFPFPP